MQEQWLLPLYRHYSFTFVWWMPSPEKARLRSRPASLLMWEQQFPYPISQPL